MSEPSAGGPAALEAAERELSRACSLLQRPSPAGLEECGCALAQVEAMLRACLASTADERLRAGALGLRGSLRRAGRLIEAARQHHAGWEERLALLTVGYTAEGRPVARAGGGRLLVEA